MSPMWGASRGLIISAHTNGEEIVVDANENVYVTGRTNDPEFPHHPRYLQSLPKRV